MFKIVSKLIFCGDKVTEEDMLEKIFMTLSCIQFAPAAANRQRGFKK